MAGFGSESGADALFTQNARVGPALAFYLNGHSTTKRYADERTFVEQPDSPDSDMTQPSAPPPENAPSAPASDKLDDAQRKQIADALSSAKVQIRCPMCGNEHFTVLEGYFVNSLSSRLGSIHLGGPSVPAAVIVCMRCGFLSQHALGVLGLLPAAEEAK